MNVCSWSFLKLWIVNILQYSRFLFFPIFLAIMKNAAVNMLIHVLCICERACLLHIYVGAGLLSHRVCISTIPNCFPK